MKWFAGSGDITKTSANQLKPCEFVAPPPPPGNPQHRHSDVVDDVTQVYLTKRDSLTSSEWLLSIFGFLKVFSHTMKTFFKQDWRL